MNKTWTIWTTEQSLTCQVPPLSWICLPSLASFLWYKISFHSQIQMSPIHAGSARSVQEEKNWIDNSTPNNSVSYTQGYLQKKKIQGVCSPLKVFPISNIQNVKMENKNISQCKNDSIKMACALHCEGIKIIRNHPNTSEGLGCFQDHQNRYSIFSFCQLAYTLRNLLSC